jgi:hypothetical protein
VQLLKRSDGVKWQAPESFPLLVGVLSSRQLSWRAFARIFEYIKANGSRQHGPWWCTYFWLARRVMAPFSRAEYYMKHHIDPKSAGA